MNAIKETIHSARQMVAILKHEYPPTWQQDANKILDKAAAELAALQERVAAQDKVISGFEWDETTGECLMGCGGCSADGHAVDCKYVRDLVDNGLMTLEKADK